MIERLIIFTLFIIVSTLLFAYLQWRARRRAEQLVNIDPLLAGARRNVATIVYFTLPNCQPCATQQQPALERLQADLGERVQIIRVDAAHDPDAAARWGVFSAPTTFVLRQDGTASAVNRGAVSADMLKRQLESAQFMR